MKEERIAAKIFQQYGLSLETAIRAGGWTNEVWFNDDLVLRLSLAKGSNRIRREIQLSRMLPALVGYPVNISSGVIEGYEWSISKRIEGINLSEAWPNLSWAERTYTVKQIWEIIKAVHAVDVEKVEGLSSKKPWYSSLDADEILFKFKCYVDKGIFTSEQGAALSDVLKRFWNKLSIATVVLNHGDITMDNILWNEGKIVSLMDFEHSVIAPREIDLNSFINLAFFHEEGNTIIDENDSVEFQQYKFQITKLFSPILKQPDSIDLLFGYAILFNQRFLDFWLENPKGSIIQFEPYIKLVSFTGKDGAYLSQLLNL
jgi:aminoglycoside phosphotransferase (APT) family kinase protein